MDSTLPHLKDSRGRLLDSWWTRVTSVQCVVTLAHQPCFAKAQAPTGNIILSATDFKSHESLHYLILPNDTNLYFPAA